MALKVGVVGLGNIGNLHCECHSKDELAELVCVCDWVRDRADKAAERFGVEAFYTLKDMLNAHPELDIVDVTTGGIENGSWHYVPAMEAIAAGKNVLCEKPLSNDVREAREMVRFAAEKDVYLGCNLNHYFAEPSFIADGLLKDGKIGEPVYLLQKMGFDGSTATYSAPNGPRWQKPYSHTKAFLAHPFSLMRHFNGDVTHVQCFMDKPGCRKSADDLMMSINGVHMLFENGSIGYIISERGDANFGLGGWWSLEMAGTKGTFCIEGCTEKLTYWGGATPEGRPEPVIYDFTGTPFNDTFPKRIHCYLEDVTNKVPKDYLRASGRDALATVEMTFAAIKSWEEGGVPVRPEPLPNFHGTPEFVL